jgi:biotin carboxyl carrier protein
MKKFLISVNGTQYDVDVEEVTGSAAAMTPTAAQQAAPSAVPAEKPVLAAAPAFSTATAPVAAKSPAAPVAGSLVISCPMPGTILKIPVAVGETVKKNQVLCVLEAMKMENEIVSPRDAIVAGIMVTKGAAVNAGDPMISLI